MSGIFTMSRILAAAGPTGPSLIFDEDFTAGSDSGPPAYVGYGAGFLGSITSDTLGSYVVGGAIDDNTNGYFMVIINTLSNPDPGSDFLTDVLLDDVSIWSALSFYDFGSLGTDLAVWYFSTQGITNTSVYNLKLWGG